MIDSKSLIDEFSAPFSVCGFRSPFCVAFRSPVSVFTTTRLKLDGDDVPGLITFDILDMTK